MKNRIIIFLALFAIHFSYAGTPYKGTGGKIKDNGSGVIFSMTLSGISPDTCNGIFGLESVTIKITHPDVSQLEFYLKAPDGTQILLYQFNQKGKNFDSTIISDTGTISLGFGTAPFIGSFKPYNDQLKRVNNGQKANGTWELLVYDASTTKGRGSLGYWYLTFGNKPAYDVHLISSNLPIININSRRQTFSHNTTINTYCDVIYNSAGKRNYLKDSLKYRNYAGMHLHGNTALSFPKVSYSLQIQDSKNNKINTSVAGFPKDNDYTLNAQYDDKTLIRNSLAMQYFVDMGHYSSRTQMVEVVVDGVYCGVYTLEEKIKVSKDRVNIEKLSSTATKGDSITGGYIFKKDFVNGTFYGGWYSKILTLCSGSVYYQFDVPVNTAQQAYGQAYVDSFEAALNASTFQDTVKGWRKYGDEKSLVDYFIHCEFTKNVDAFQWSTYFFKDRRSADGGKIHMGPIWDQDLGLGNCTARTGDQTSGWCYQTNCNLNPFWWSRFMKDTTFKNNMRCRWNRLRLGTFSDSSMDRRTDSMAAYLSESQKRNFNEWNILGIQTYYNSWLPPTYQGEIDTMKYWMKKRNAWLDKYIPGTCRVDYTPPVVNLIGHDTAYLEVYDSYIDSGITYNDNRDGKNCRIVISSNVDSTTLGTYQYWYDVYDQSKNKTSVLRIVKVIDTIAPSIILNGNANVSIVQNDIYSDSGYTATDNYDLNPVIDTNGNFTDTKTPGIFFIRYKVRDHSGNIGDSVTRIINISTFTSIEKFVDGAGKVLIYPNPVTGDFFITADAGTKTMKVSIYDALGKKLEGADFTFSGFINKQWTFPSYSAPGIYYLKIQSGDDMEMKKIVLMK